MAARESLQEYYLHLHQTIEHYLNLCLSHPEEELVHQLRLSIKKLRAFNKLAEQVCLTETDEHIHLKSSINQFYKTAGQLRDTQVQLQLLGLCEDKKGISYPEYHKWLQRREKKRIARIGKMPKHGISHATPAITMKKISGMLAVTDGEAVISSADLVLSRLFSEAQQMAEGTLPDSDLHRIRILSKQMRYIITTVQHIYPDFRFRDIATDSLREIETTTGNWHDCLVKVELVSRWLAKSDHSEDAAMLKYKELLEDSIAELRYSYSEACEISLKVLTSVS